MRIDPTTRPAVSAGLLVGAAAGSLAEIDTALVADSGLLDKPGAADSWLGGSTIDGDCDDKADDWTDDTDAMAADVELSWQHRRVRSGCIAGRNEVLDKCYGMLEAKGDGKMAEAAE